MVATTRQLIRPVSRFQRAIHIRYDLGDPDAIEQYIPTQSAVTAIGAVLRSTDLNGTQRAHVLHAAYGSGKSHLAVALAALLEKDNNLIDSVERFVAHIKTTNQELGDVAKEYVAGDKRLFPVVLSGNEGDFSTAILRALMRSLKEAGITQLELTTRFEAALDTIERWEIEYPDVLQRLQAGLREKYGQSFEQFQNNLKHHQPDAYDIFTGVYSKFTAGAVFDPLIEQTPDIVYRDAVAQIRKLGFSGIVVIWDEFGRYLEGHVSQAFGNEAALLQSFAETCNYSGENQIHLLLLTHKELQGYASSLPQSYQQEWSRIEGRFQRHNISTDPYVAYRLIASAIQYVDENIVYDLLSDDTVDWFVHGAKEYRLFGTLPEMDIRSLLYDTFPLHPITVFALAHLSSRVAQNERTMFTFLTSDEPHAFRELVETRDFSNGSNIIIQLAALWNYFENSIRADIGGSGAYRHWSSVEHALDKVLEGDVLGEAIVKSIGVLTICAETTPIRPTLELLQWSLDAREQQEQDEIIANLGNLRRRKVVIHRQIDGYWTFISGSDINFEAELNKILDRINPTHLQLRYLLEQTIPAPYTLARRYNQEYAMTRYFTGVYLWPDELKNIPLDALIEKHDADGLIIYVLATDDISWENAFNYIQRHDRVIYVFPREDNYLLSLMETLREFFALKEIQNDPSLRQHDDRERIEKEIAWIIEDAKGRLENTINTLLDPRQGKSVWIQTNEENAYGYHVSNPGQATKLVSDICQEVFPKTPILNSEGLNRRKPSTQQNKAAELVIDAMFACEPGETFGMEGRGPEILALNALLKIPGVLRQDDGYWILDRPLDNTSLSEVWDYISDYFDTCETGDGTPIAPLINQLTSPPYGLREGVLPVILAAVLRERLKVTTVWKGRRAVGAVTGDVLIQIVDDPDAYSIEIGEWNPALSALWNSLVAQFSYYINEGEQDQHPLKMISTAMVRWLQGLPSFSRETRQISNDAIKLRDTIRKAQIDPARALFQALPQILDIVDADRDVINNQIDALMQEISNSYLDLQRRLDKFISQEFGASGLAQDSLLTLKNWLAGIRPNGSPITEFKFSSLVTQDFVDTILNAEESDTSFLNKAAEAVIGVALRDWNDNSEERFYEKLIASRDEIERDAQELIEDDKVVTFSLQLPDSDTKDFRFRSSDLSTQGQRILQNFKTTMGIAGRPLSIDEKRKIGLAFLIHIMGEDLDD